MKKATSKIKEVVRTKDFTNNYGTTIYHSLLMENGDKIEIGKKTLQKVGWELSYEIIDDGHEYNKAKTIKPEEVPGAVVAEKPSFNAKDPATQKMIIAQSSIGYAIEYLKMNHGVSEQDVLKTAEVFYSWVLQKGGVNG